MGQGKIEKPYKVKKGDYIVARRWKNPDYFLNPNDHEKAKKNAGNRYILMRALRVGRDGNVKHVANKQAWEAQHPPNTGNTTSDHNISMVWTLGVYARNMALDCLMDKEFDSLDEIQEAIEKAVFVNARGMGTKGLNA